MSRNKWFSEDKESEIQFIVQKLTTTGRKTLDDEKIKKLKDICKYVSCYICYVFLCNYFLLMNLCMIVC